MKCGQDSIDVLLNEIERQARMKKDIISPADQMHLETSEAGGCRLIVNEEGGIQAYTLSDFAGNQLAGKLDIPVAYFRRMRDVAPDLLDLNVNRWLDRQPGVRYMVRTLDGGARAILSNRYRRLDNFDLAAYIIPALRELPGAVFESVELTERRFYIKVVCPKVQYEVQPGDIVQAGVVVSNSEIGCGATFVKPLIFRLICKNGLIAEDRKLQRNHAGRALGLGREDAWIYADDTLLAEDQAIFLKMRDTVRAAISGVTFTMLSEKLKKTLGIKLTGNPEAAVQVLANRFAMDESERKGVLQRLLGCEAPTGYGLINAITEHSQSIKDYDRATEFEEFGGKMLDFTRSEWRQIEIAE